MSKFYYQGAIQQENFLTPKDYFLRSAYGKYQLMLLEAISVLLFAIISLVIYFFDLGKLIPFSDPYARLLGGLLIVLAVINLVAYYTVLKKEYSFILKLKSYMFLFFGILLIIFPRSLQGFIYSTMATTFVLFGLHGLFSRKAGLSKKLISICLILIGVFFLFTNYNNNYKDIVFFILLGLLGFYLLVLGLQFRKSLKNYEDEQKGFTDYSIE